jgi:hypothetical protein
MSKHFIFDFLFSTISSSTLDHKYRIASQNISKIEFINTLYSKTKELFSICDLLNKSSLSCGNQFRSTHTKTFKIFSEILKRDCSFVHSSTSCYVAEHIPIHHPQTIEQGNIANLVLLINCASM